MGQGVVLTRVTRRPQAIKCTANEARGRVKSIQKAPAHCVEERRWGENHKPKKSDGNNENKLNKLKWRLAIRHYNKVMNKSYCGKY